MRNLLRSIRSHILIGGILITPVALTLWIIIFLVDRLTSNQWLTGLADDIQQLFPTGFQHAALRTLISILLVLGFLFTVGVIFRNILGKRVYRVLDATIERIPLINKIYLFVRTVSESIVSQSDSMFQEVVLIEYPRKDLYSIAFVSSDVPHEMAEKSGRDDREMTFVFIPTTPNPTSGFLLLVPKEDTHPLPLTTAEAMRLIVSAGASTSGRNLEANLPDLPEMLDSWLKHRDRNQDEHKQLASDDSEN